MEISLGRMEDSLRHSNSVARLAETSGAAWKAVAKCCLHVLLALLLAFTLINCGNDNDDDTTSTERINGRTLYEELFEALQRDFGESLTGGKGTWQFQFPNPNSEPEQASWVDTIPTYEIEQFNVGNRAPDQKGAFYSTGPGSASIFDNWIMWLGALANALPNDNAVTQALQPYQGRDAKPVDFIGTYAELLQVLGNSSGNSLSFDSSKTSDDVGKTWTGGKDVDLHGLWAGSSPNDRLSRRFAESKVIVSARFKAYAVWTSTPGSWYNSGLFNTAYSNQTTPPWPQDADPTWEDVFGPGGSMLRFIASLVVVDGVSSTVTSDAIYNELDQQTIRNNASRGLWPFYTPTKSDTVTNAVTFDDASGMKIKTITQPGNPLVIGANVIGVAQYLGHRTA